MDQNTSRQDEDELDLFALFQIIWDGKWVIVVCTALALAGVVIFLFVSKPLYKAKLLMQGPSFETISKFEQINRFNAIGKPIVADKQIVGYEDTIKIDITAKKLLEVFIDEFYDYDELREAIKQYSSNYAKFEGSGSERTKLLHGIARNFSLTKVPNQANVRDLSNSYELTFVTSNLGEAEKIVEHTLSNVFDNTNLSLLTYLNNISDATKQKSVDKISKLENEIVTKKKTLLINHNQKIHFLTEQATIARVLNLKENMHNAVALAMSETASTAIFAEAPYYLRGYKTIDKELEQLQAKDETYIFYADNIYVDLVEKLENEKTNMPHVRFDVAIEKLPLSKTDNLFRYDPMLIEFTVMTKKTLILILSLIFGSILGIVIVLFRHGYRQYQAR
jgi:LPS O-antigen subunit length determinant protein (WzzB/FepE family)